MKREITIEDKRRIQLEMLDEIDSFCRANNIHYSLAFGTLLGAIRHKGFIPWDDDVDIVMPLPDLLKFKKTFRSEKMYYGDVDNCEYHCYPFSRVYHLGSYKGSRTGNPGICIDLYVVVNVPESEDDRNRYFSILSSYQRIRKKLMKLNHKWFSLFSHRIPGLKQMVTKMRDYYIRSISYGETDVWYIIAGPLTLRHKMTYNRDLFANITEVEFEGKFYPAISEWDYFLQLRYGDYMQLPPEDMRHPYHDGPYFWK